MSHTLRVFSLVSAAACGLAAAPTQGADGTLQREAASLSISDAEAWSLRQSGVTSAEAMALRPARTIPLSDLPEERRSVRVVYDGYGEGRILRTSR